jgi:hypothetical protein
MSLIGVDQAKKDAKNNYLNLYTAHYIWCSDSAQATTCSVPAMNPSFIEFAFCQDGKPTNRVVAGVCKANRAASRSELDERPSDPCRPPCARLRDGMPRENTELANPATVANMSNRIRVQDLFFDLARHAHAQPHG